MYIGLDISKKTVVAVCKDKEGNKVWEETFETNGCGLDNLIKKLQKDDEIVLEASTSGIFVYDYLVENNFSVKVANPYNLSLIYRSEKKTDRTDAEKLVDLLRTNMLPTSYIPSKESRQLRDIIRHRRSFVITNTIWKNKIRSILAREGISLDVTDILGDKALKLLEEVELGNVQKEAIDKILSIALYTETKIEEYDKELYSEFKTNKQAKLMDTIPGIDYYSAMHIMSAIVDIKRFPSDEQLASYAGLAPRISQSGEVAYTKGLMHGDGLLKWILIQNAHAAIRCSKRFRKLYLKKKRKNGSQRAIISVARKMIEIIYCMLTRGEEYREDYNN